MRDYSYIEVHRQYSVVTGKVENQTYKVVGKSPYVKISMCSLLDLGVNENKFPEKFYLGGYKFLFVEQRYFEFATYIKAGGIRNIVPLLYRISKPLDLFYRRLIITLAVWGLARYQGGVVPSWRDIKLFRRN